MVGGGASPCRPAAAGASRRQDRAGAADRAGVLVAARRHSQIRRRSRSAGADARRAAAARRSGGGRRRGGAAGAGEAPAHHRRRCGVAKPRACRTGGVGGAARRAGLRRVRAQHGVIPGIASAVPRRHVADAEGGPRDSRPARRAVLGRRRPVRAVAAVRHRADAEGSALDPSRHRSVGARQELSAQGCDPRRSEGDAARYHRQRCASA